MGPGFWGAWGGAWGKRTKLNLPSLSAQCPLCKRMSWSSSQKAFSVTTLAVSLTSFVQWNLSPY